MIHSELIKISSKWLRKHKNNIDIPNCRLVSTELVSATNSGEIPDVIGWSSYQSVLLEIKISKSDFLKDKNKIFRKTPKLGVGDLRFYVVPEGLVNIQDIPKGWGLLYVSEKGEIKTVKLSKTFKPNLNCERTILLSIARRNKIK